MRSHVIIILISAIIKDLKCMFHRVCKPIAIARLSEMSCAYTALIASCCVQPFRENWLTDILTDKQPGHSMYCAMYMRYVCVAR